MTGPTTWVLALLELLQARGLLSGADIAERLGVDRRTVRRYMSVLEDLGIPVTTEQGRYGGYRLVPGFKLPPLMFSESEMRVVMLALLAVREHSLLDDDMAVASVQAKLERVVPEYLKTQIQVMDRTIQLFHSRMSSGHQQLLQLTQATHAREWFTGHHRVKPCSAALTLTVWCSGRVGGTSVASAICARRGAPLG